MVFRRNFVENGESKIAVDEEKVSEITTMNRFSDKALILVAHN
jgi:hypothetical protein